MKKTTLYTLLVFVLLLAAAVIVFFNKYSLVRIDQNGEKKWKIEEKKGTLRVLRDFAVQDTASVDKIFLADKQNATILLERKDNYWTVNGKYRARKDFIEVLLETIHRVEVAEPVTETKVDHVLRRISTDGIKVEIYQQGKLSKTYYVGGVDQGNTGTYMLLEGSSQPFVTHIPGFAGFLTTRYNTSLYEWRDRVIFRYKVSDIAAVSLEYPDNKFQSFRCERIDNNKFKLFSLPDMQPVPVFDTLAVKSFMSRFKFVGFEAYLDNTIPPHTRDSVLNSEMLCKYIVEDIHGNKQSLKAFPRPNVLDQFDDEGEMYPYDVERLYGFINNDEDMVLLQYYIIDPLTKDLNQFLLSDIVNN
jgi:hypothetical protein